MQADGQITVSATIEGPRHKHKLLWYRLPIEYSSALTRTCDSFLLATLFTAMHKATDLVIHGQVSPSLLRNLEEFQAVWNRWQPNRYSKIEINADIEQESPKNNKSDKALVSFSGGIDSCFTAWRHRTGSCGRSCQNIEAGVLVHGFDIPIDESDAFNRASENARKILQSLGMKLITISTNFRQLGDDWEDAQGAAMASCMMLLQRNFNIGLIASSFPYHRLLLPWGSNPLTDALLSSDVFKIIHDGAAFTRIDKVREIQNWPEALRYLRVCWQGQQKDRNCGRCEKCIRTILNFRVTGLGLPPCFEQDVTDRQILALKGLDSVAIAFLNDILSTAKAASINESWVHALKKCLKRNQRAAAGQRNLVQKIRKAIGLRTRLRRLISSLKLTRQWELIETRANK